MILTSLSILLISFNFTSRAELPIVKVQCIFFQISLLLNNFKAVKITSRLHRFKDRVGNSAIWNQTLSIYYQVLKNLFFQRARSWLHACLLKSKEFKQSIWLLLTYMNHVLVKSHLWRFMQIAKNWLVLTLRHLHYPFSSNRRFKVDYNINFDFFCDIC